MEKTKLKKGAKPKKKLKKVGKKKPRYEDMADPILGAKPEEDMSQIFKQESPEPPGKPNDLLRDAESLANRYNYNVSKVLVDGSRITVEFATQDSDMTEADIQKILREASDGS